MSTSVVPKFPEISSHHSLNRTNSESRSTVPLPSPSANNTVSTPPNNSNQSSGSSSALNQTAAPGGDPNASSSDGSGIPVGGGTDSGSAENSTFDGTHHGLGAAYVDAIVERHARRILGEGKLRDLGKLAAHLDFHLVTWLRKEKRRKPVMVLDFVAAIKMIHSEFEWPYPDFVAPVVHHSRTPSTGMYYVLHNSRLLLYLQLKLIGKCYFSSRFHEIPYT